MKKQSYRKIKPHIQILNIKKIIINQKIAFLILIFPCLVKPLKINKRVEIKNPKNPKYITTRAILFRLSDAIVGMLQL